MPDPSRTIREFGVALLARPDEMMLEVGATGELLVARIRVVVAGLLLLLPLVNNLAGGTVAVTRGAVGVMVSYPTIRPISSTRSSLIEMSRVARQPGTVTDRTPDEEVSTPNCRRSRMSRASSSERASPSFLTSQSSGNKIPGGGTISRA